VQLLLDSHLPRAVAEGLRRAGIDAMALAEWLGGAFREAEDELILTHAAEEGRVIVTFDRRTVPSLLARWAAGGRSHAGVVLIDEKTIRQDDRRGLIRALQAFVAEHADEDWRNQVRYLPRP
jgi:predicted nuclease of predicted toxin-antitoxin system